MVFLNTWAFWLGGIAPTIVLLYLLKVKRRPAPVSTLLFWQRVLQENRRRALFQRLRQLLSLLLQLLIFALVMLALARPMFDRLVRSGSATVLVIDTRARMQAQEPGGETRFSLALRAAQRFARDAGSLRQVAILAGGGEPSVVVPFTGDEKTLRAGLAQLQPTDATGDLEPSIHLARELLASHAGGARLVVITDRRLESAAGTPAPEYVSVATPRDNVAITQFAARALPASPETCEVLLDLHNFGETAVSGNVELTLDGRTFDVRPFQLAAGESSHRTFPFLPPETASGGRGWLVAHLDTHDALPLDDTAYATLPVRPPLAVLLITKGNWFLEKLLAADPRVRFELLDPESFSPEIAARFQAIVLDDWMPPGLTLAQLPGNVLFLGATPFASGEPEIAQPVITDVDATSPLLRSVKLENVTVRRANALAVPKDADGWRFSEPLRFTDRPLLITGTRPRETGEQRLAAVAFRVLDSDLPLRVAFPLMISNTLQWLAGANVTETPSLRAGESLPLEASMTAYLPPQLPNTLAASGPASEERGEFRPLRDGFYRLRTGESDRWLAVNTASEAESDLRSGVAPVAAPAGEISAALLRRLSFAGWPAWQMLAVAALLLFTGEWWLFHRRRTE